VSIPKSIPVWDSNQVKITKTLVYRSDDSRVDLSTGGTQFITTALSTDHTPTIGPDEVGFIFVKFILDRPIKAPNMSVTLTVQIGSRTDTLLMSNDDKTKTPVVVWQVWSDKYFNETIAKVKIDVEVTPPPSDVLGAPVQWTGNQAIALPLGRIKKPATAIKIALPELTDPAQRTLANQYIVQALKEASGS
jgi:hypothetical protein